jgi:hypothetical protein
MNDEATFIEGSVECGETMIVTSGKKMGVLIFLARIQIRQRG